MRSAVLTWRVELCRQLAVARHCAAIRYLPTTLLCANRICLRLCYALSGTDGSICLWLCYALSGIDTQHMVVSAYGFAMRCPVLTYSAWQRRDCMTWDRTNWRGP
eukprot:869265-Rhodomonas_salina.2